MRAALYHRYGGPEVVSIAEIPTPVPKDGEVLVKIYCSTVNRTDTGFRSAQYFISRLFTGLLRPKRPLLGTEFAGEVVGMGRGVTLFRRGDRVFGYDEYAFGGNAEFKTIDESASITTIPEGIDYLHAAALTEGSHYALNTIRAARVKQGDTVMVYGATGAIGSAAVQLLKHLGTYVVAVANTVNVELVKSLGADQVIDYQTEDFKQSPHRFDFILDAVGKTSFPACQSILKDQGIYISTELGKNGQNIWLALAGKFGTGKKVLFPIPKMGKEQINYIRNLAAIGAFRPVIDRQYLLDDIVEAHRYAQSGQKTGNVIVRLIDG